MGTPTQHRFQLGLLALPVLLLSWNAVAEGRAKVVRPPAGTKITGLYWTKPNVEIKKMGGRDIVIVEGKFINPGYALSVGSKTLSVAKDGKFTIAVPMNPKGSAIIVSARGPGKPTLTEKVMILPVGAGRPEGGRGPTPSFYVGLAASSISYSETDYPTFSEMGVTLKANFSRLVSPQLILGIGGYMTLFATAPDVTPDKVPIKFLGINARLGYVIPFQGTPWRLSLLGGLYYTTTIVEGEKFGFKNMSGPQVFAVLGRSLGGRQSVSGYVKYAAVAGNGTIFTPGNSEKAFGLNYEMPLTSDKMLQFTLDIASLGLQVDAIDPVTGDAIPVEISSTSVSVGVGIGF